MYPYAVAYLYRILNTKTHRSPKNHFLPLTKHFLFFPSVRNTLYNKLAFWSSVLPICRSMRIQFSVPIRILQRTNASIIFIPIAFETIVVTDFQRRSHLELSQTGIHRRHWLFFLFQPVHAMYFVYSYRSFRRQRPTESEWVWVVLIAWLFVRCMYVALRHLSVGGI